MAVKVVVPRLGWSMDEGTFVEWLKQDGQWVQAGEMLFVLEGEKATQEVESFDAGVLRIPPDAPQPQETVRVGQLLAYLVQEGEPLPQPETGEPNLTEQTAAEESVSPEADPILAVATSHHEADSTRPHLRQATPRARRAARRLGVNCADVPGSGRNGRVRERDVLAMATGGASGQLTPASSIRRSIAQRMLAAVQQTAPVTLTTKSSAAGLVRRKQQLLKADAIPCPTYTDMIAWMAAATLRELPELNCSWRNDAVFSYDAINISLAVDTDTGLMAPVIRNAAELSLTQFAEQASELARLARNSELAADQMREGTFTVTNLGMFGIDAFTPIINLPQAAILGIGRVVREPVLDGDQVVPGHTITLSLTFDHQAIDGAPAARWLQRLAQRISEGQLEA